MNNELTIQKTLEEFKGTKVDYALPNSDVDIGNMYFYACRFEEALRSTLFREAMLRNSLKEVEQCLGRDYWGDKPATYNRVKEALSSEYPKENKNG